MSLEELLNKLLERGWKPFDVDVKIKRAKCFHSVHFIFRRLVNFVLDGYAEATVPLRELCAKESGLWQFVCENGMIDKENKLISGIKEKRWTHETSMKSFECLSIFYEDEMYWVIESALKDESELESFILENIKIG